MFSGTCTTQQTQSSTPIGWPALTNLEAYLFSMGVPIIWVLIQSLGNAVDFGFKILGGTTQTALGEKFVLNMLAPH